MTTRNLSMTKPSLRKQKSELAVLKNGSKIEMKNTSVTVVLFGATFDREWVKYEN